MTDRCLYLSFLYDIYVRPYNVLFNKKNSLKKRMHFFTINICISHINNISEKKNSNSNFILPSLFFVCSI